MPQRDVDQCSDVMKRNANSDTLRVAADDDDAFKFASRAAHFITAEAVAAGSQYRLFHRAWIINCRV
jgi:hypothetical protein